MQRQPPVVRVGPHPDPDRALPPGTWPLTVPAVAQVVAEIEQRIRERTRSAVGGAVNRAARTRPLEAIAEA